MNIKRITMALLVASGLMLAAPPMSQAQYKEKNYGNTPDKLVPYENFSKAYKKHFIEPIPFRGTGREKPAPANLDAVKIGFLGPFQNTVDSAFGKQMAQGARLAMEQANVKGGYRGLPYELLLHNDAGLWGAAANEVVAMDDEGVWVILGSLNDIVTHVAIRAALKCEIPVVNMADPDPTLTETNIPWVVRVISDDRQSSYALTNRIFTLDGHDRVALIRTNSRYGRVGTGEFKDASRRLGHPVTVEVRFENGDTDFTEQLNIIKNSQPDAVTIWGNAREMALIINQMRQMGMDYPVYTSDRAVSDEFLQLAGKNANGVVTTSQYNPKADNPKLRAFQQAYRERFGMEPDVFAAHAYDAMNITIKAIELKGLNRALIRDALTDMHTFQNYEGVAGTIVFDASWNDVGQIFMAEVKGGEFVFTPFVMENQAFSGSVK